MAGGTCVGVYLPIKAAGFGLSFSLTPQKMREQSKIDDHRIFNARRDLERFSRTDHKYRKTVLAVRQILREQSERRAECDMAW